MKIYTKKGDKGKTSIFGGKKLSKDHSRIEAYGNVDEFNAQVGVLMSMNIDKVTHDLLFDLQKNLFTIGAILATDPQKLHLVKPFKSENITFIEEYIDKIEADLPPLKSFILPSGSPEVSQCHVVRTVCRRAERRIVSLYEIEEGSADLLIYINRLSDFFFVLARKLCVDTNCNEYLWLGD